MFFRKRADSGNTTVIPPPRKVQPTTDFDGNDGKWSTFFINIGGDGENASLGQNFRILPSTSSAITLVPAQADWCDTECAKGRGVETLASRQPLGFETTSTWQEKGGILSIPLAETLRLWPDASPNGTWGIDNVGIGQTGSLSQVLSQQWVVQSTSPDFYMGSFGLAALPVAVDGQPRTPFLTNFEYFNVTLSNSYGYTAGASYRNNNKGVPGSLILGGYDQSRLTNYNITVPFPSAGNNSLLVAVQSITYKPDQDVQNNVFSLTPDGNQFPAIIDSTLPYLWLPKDVCDQFADKYQLTYDKTRNLYTVNDTAHSYNQRLNAKATIIINPGSSSAGSVSIELPYAAFDLQASKPIFDNATNYFPIKQSPTGVYVLGRTFLQEAYLVVNYELGQFQVAPANYADPMPEERIVPIFSKKWPQPSDSSNSTSTGNDGGGGGLSGGAIAGIVVGILAVVLLAGVGFFFWWKKKRQQKRLSEKEDPQEIDTTAAGGEVKHRRVSELDSEPPNSPKPSMGGYYGKEGKDTSPFPTINEMESPPAELYSPPPPAGDTPRSERSERDYFTNSKPRRRGATRESSGNNTPGTPGVIHELPGDDGEFQVEGQHFERVPSPTQNSPVHSRGPSDTSLNTNIDQVIADSREPSQAPPDRRPSMHNRGPSDAPTVQSDSTAVSDPTPEERERWAAEDDGPGRPLSE